MFARWCAASLRKKLARPYVHLVFGARQTGKSTLIRSLLPLDALIFDLSDPEQRSHYLAVPGDFIRACRAVPVKRSPRFVFVDEVQAVPAIFDAVQNLYDGEKQRWRFVLCGSAARRLRLTGANLLPGRSLLHRIVPLTLVEHPSVQPAAERAASPLPFHWPGGKVNPLPFPASDLTTRLAFGELPGVVAASERDRPTPWAARPNFPQWPQPSARPGVGGPAFRSQGSHFFQ